MSNLLANPKIINIGTPLFETELKKQGVSVVQVDWRPPAGGDVAAAKLNDVLMKQSDIDAANKIALSRINSAQPVLVDMELAINAVPGMHSHMILHAGPPIEYECMCGPMQGAVQGALIYEGLASSVENAHALASSGAIEFRPCNEMGCVGPMAGIISPHMPVHVVENKTFGNCSYATVNEGLGKVLRFGANSSEVINRLCFIRDTFFPVMRRVIRDCGGINLKNLTAQGLTMGDECHNRNKATTSILLRDILPTLLKQDSYSRDVLEVIRFIGGNEHYFLNLSMAACKATLDAVDGIKHSTIVTTMARNGVGFGIRVSGVPENQWFVAPANMVEGLFFPGFTNQDAARDLGDSCITETCGVGGFAMAASPAIVQFVGGTVHDAIEYSREMYEITEGESSAYLLPMLNFGGSATGIDVRKVIATGILPVINTGIAHKDAGVGQIGAGIVHPPMECFTQAVKYMAATW
ncbi:MAG: DUF1116 domain-containing protein [Eggerthellaceae bacterium]|jgi:hypothetical protein